VIFRCPICDKEVRSWADVGDLRLELRRKWSGTYQRIVTASLGKVCMSCGRAEVEKRRPARAAAVETLRLEGL